MILQFGYAVLHKIQVTPVAQYSADSTSTHAKHTTSVCQ